VPSFRRSRIPSFPPFIAQNFLRKNFPQNQKIPSKMDSLFFTGGVSPKNMCDFPKTISSFPPFVAQKNSKYWQAKILKTKFSQNQKNSSIFELLDPKIGGG
jgi:hypothetical protein